MCSNIATYTASRCSNSSGNSRKHASSLTNFGPTIDSFIKGFCQIVRYECGIPDYPLCVMVEAEISIWIPQWDLLGCVYTAKSWLLCAALQRSETAGGRLHHVHYCDRSALWVKWDCSVCVCMCIRAPLMVKHLFIHTDTHSLHNDLCLNYFFSQQSALLKSCTAQCTLQTVHAPLAWNVNWNEATGCI